MKRRDFIWNTGILSTALILNSKRSFSAWTEPQSRRPSLSNRKFRSEAVEAAIKEFKLGVRNEKLGWLFENCFPNTLDTTVFFDASGPDTYIITGDIDAMWLRDSTAQVWPYMEFLSKDPDLKKMIAGLIHRQSECILRDPYANAFYKDAQKVSEWKSDLTEMKPGVHERKWEIDSLCYPIHLAHRYWKETSDTSPFTGKWKEALMQVYAVFREQQRRNGPGSYHFQRSSAVATDTVPMGGFGYPVKPVGLICSAFRPSDDATVFSFLIPSNFFAARVSQQASEILEFVYGDRKASDGFSNLSNEIKTAIEKYAIVQHPEYGKIYSYEIDGFGSRLLMDDANVPSLLGLPYIGALSLEDPVYRNTRKFVLSADNPFYFSGKAARGIGGPHVGMNMIWPISLTVQALTANNSSEFKNCLEMLVRSGASTGFMHESFDKDNPENFTRSWFAWANTLFGEMLWKTYRNHPDWLNGNRLF